MIRWTFALLLAAVMAMPQTLARGDAAAQPATAPATAPVVIVQDDGSLLLKAAGARIHGYRLHLTGKDEPFLFYWIDRDEYPEWPLAVAKKGTYAVEVTYSCAPRAGGDFGVFAAANNVRATTQETPDWITFKTVKLGNLTVVNDATSVSLRCTGRLDRALMCVRSIKLTPVPDAPKK